MPSGGCLRERTLSRHLSMSVLSGDDPPHGSNLSCAEQLFSFSFKTRLANPDLIWLLHFGAKGIAYCNVTFSYHFCEGNPITFSHIVIS